MSNLLVIKGANVGMRYELGKNTTIGRSPENHIQILDPNVSRFHCEIIQRGVSFYLRDQSSKNGVLVNGEQAQERTLLRNDEVVIGNTYFLFNTDHDLKNTRFSNKRVYFTSPTDATITPLQDPAAVLPTQAYPYSPRDLVAVQLLHDLGTLFAFSQLPLSEALERLLQTLAKIFNAQRGCLMMWDPMTAEFTPLVALSEEENFHISLNVLRAVLEEKHAVLVHPPALDKDTVATLRMENPPEAPGTKGVALCVPLFKSELPAAKTTAKSGDRAEGVGEIIGLLYLEIANSDNLLLYDVQLLQSVANLTQVAVEHYEILDNLERERPKDVSNERKLIGRSRAFNDVINLVEKVAKVDSTVLLTGETGTGKEMFAREIHRLSPRQKYPFIAINCAAIPETLIESELFGYERGAFTGADKQRRGLFESAHGGTLFLDEIGEMEITSQTKLLRFLQERVITRVGGNQPIRVDVRIIAATNANLEESIRTKSFREDLWFRLNVFAIHLPPLRERREDIQLLSDFFLKRYAREYNKQLIGITDDALRLLEMHPWPGNIREMQNVIERAVLLSDATLLQPEDFPLLRRDNQKVNPHAPTVMLPLPIESTALADAERSCIQRALDACEWNQVQAARQLDIHRNTLRKKILEYGLNPEK